MVSVLTALIIAIITRGKYYIAREQHFFATMSPDELIECAICNKSYEARDMVYCLAYNEKMCSLCCCLDLRCKDICKRKRRRRNRQPQESVSPPRGDSILDDFPLHFRRFFRLFAIVAGSLASVFGIFYYQAVLTDVPNLEVYFKFLTNIFVFVLIIAGICVWWISLEQEHRQKTELELDQYILSLEQEITEHKKTAANLERAQRQTEIELMHRRKISEALKANTRQQELILSNITIGIAHTKNNRLDWCNNRFVQLTNLGRKRLNGFPTRGLFPDDGTYEQIILDSDNVLSAGNCYTTEVQMTRDNSEFFWCRLVGNALDSDSVREGIIWMLDDITERKQTLQDLRNSEERLRELNENLEGMVKERTNELERSYQSLRQADKMASLGILVAGMAHELNNPIGFIKLNSKIISDAMEDILPFLEQCAPDHEEITIAGMDYQYAKRSIPKLLFGIQEGTDRISGIVSNLRDYSRKTPLKIKSPVDVNQVVEASLSLLANAIKKATNRLDIKMQANLPNITGDFRGIEQVLINLLQNSCQALTDKRQAIRIKTYKENNHVFIQIEDEGPGIPAEHLTRVLDPFFTTKREKGGTGLGLSISHEIVEKHEGSMIIENAIGGGTSVTLSFRASENGKKG